MSDRSRPRATALADLPDRAAAAGHPRYPRGEGGRHDAPRAASPTAPESFPRSRPTADGWRTPRPSPGRRSDVRPFPETASAKWQVSTQGGAEPSWSSTGRELLYINGKGDMVSAEIPAGPTFSVGKQRTLFPMGQFAGNGPVHLYSLSPDNKRFVVLREGEAGQPGSWWWRRTGRGVDGGGREVAEKRARRNSPRCAEVTVGLPGPYVVARTPAPAYSSCRLHH